MKMILPADKITTVLTSCGRWDMLINSIDTFLRHHEPARFILVEDSADHGFAERLRLRYPFIEIVLNDPRLGQHKAVDRVYAMIETPYVLHLEDDWHFVGAMDVEPAIALLQENPHFLSVCFVRFTGLKLRQRIFRSTFKFAGATYARMNRSHRDWHGFSFYPSVLRLETWKTHGPYAKFQNERTISRYMKDRAMEVVYRLPGVGIHVGSGKSVFDPARADEKRRVTGALWSRLRGRTRYFFDKD